MPGNIKQLNEMYKLVENLDFEGKLEYERYKKVLSDCIKNNKTRNNEYVWNSLFTDINKKVINKVNYIKKNVFEVFKGISKKL